MDFRTPRRVGKSQLQVTPLGFGAGHFGNPRLSTGVCLETLEAAYSGGVRFFDTAPEYGLGRSERRLGMALADQGGRDEFRINTKVGRRLEPEPVREEANKTYAPNGDVRTPRDPRSGHRVHFDYSYEALLGQQRDSLTRLGMARVDGLTIHDLDYGYHTKEQANTALDQLSRQGGGGARALEELRRDGLIQAIGLGCNREMKNFRTWDGGEHEDLVERIADTVDLDFLVVAGPYTLLDTLALRRVLPLCESREIGVIIASPFAGGWLVAPGEIPYMYGETPATVKDKTTRMQTICEAHAVPLAAAALQFPLAHPAVAAVIPGANAPAEAIEAQRLLGCTVPPEVWATFKSDGLLDETAPTP